MSDELNIIMGTYIDSGKYTPEELEELRKLTIQRLDGDQKLQKEVHSDQSAKDEPTTLSNFGQKFENVLEQNIYVQGSKLTKSLKIEAGEFINFLDPTGGKVMDYIVGGGDIHDSPSDQKVGEAFDNWVSDQYRELDEVSKYASTLGTGEGIVGGFKEGNILDIGLGVSNALVSGITTIVPAIWTRGKSLAPQIMAPMYTEFNSEKAKSLYPDMEIGDAIKKLRENGEDEVVVPVALGALSFFAERIGFKAIRGAMTKGAKTAGGRELGLYFSTGSKEFATEVIQHGLNEANLSQAKGDDWETTSKKFINSMMTQEGLEAGLQGFVAGGTISAGGARIQRAFRTDKDNLEINQYINTLSELNQKRLKAVTPELKQKYEKDYQQVTQALRDTLIIGRKKSTYLTKEQTDEIIESLDFKNDLNSQIDKIKQQKERNIITEEQYNDYVQDINSQLEARDNRINEIKTEANKKLLQDGLRIDQEAISRMTGLEMKVFSTPELFLEAVNAQQRIIGQQQGKTFNDLTLESIRGVDGLVIGNQIMVNEATAAENNAISVGSHELLHSIVKSSLNQGGQLTKDGAKLIQDFIQQLTPQELAVVQKRIDDNYRFLENPDGTFKLDENGERIENPFESYAEEYLTAYADASIKNELSPSTYKKIGNFFERIFNKGDKGYKNLSFKTGSEVKEFLDSYVSDRKKGRFRNQFVEMAQEGIDMETGEIRTIVIKKHKTRKKDLTPEQRQDEINKLGRTYNDKDLDETVSFEQPGGDAFWGFYSDKIAEDIQKQGLLDGAILEKYKKYKNNLDKIGVTKKTFLDGVYAELLPHIRNYKPEKQLEYAEKDRTGLNGWIIPQLDHKALQAYEVITKGQIQVPTVDIGQTTKEGDIKVQVEADIDQSMLDLETMDMSPQATAKREAQKNKKKEVRKSKLRQDYGVEDGSDIYNSVLNSARQSLILAYQKTRDIKNKNDRAAAIVKMIADEYAGEKGLTSGRYTELFKQVKNSLGTKEYINNLKKNRESIVESIFTSDFVQIERNVPDSEKIFTKFVKKLTSKQEVQDAVDKGLLPKDSLKAIDKGQAVNLYEKVMPTENQFVGFFDQPLTVEKTDKTGKIYYVRSGLKGTRKDGLSKHMSKAFIFDALMEVRQEPGVNELLTNEFNAELDIVDLASKISRDVNVKFSKSTAIADVDNAIDNGTNTDVYLEVKFSKSHRDQYERRLEKNRPDLTEEQRKNAVQSIFDFVNKNDIPNNKKAKLEKLALHYMANGYLILPEDGYKVIEAERVATIKKLDAFSYKNPNVLLEENVVKKKVKRTDPDKVKTFSNKTEYSDGVVVYDVEDSKQGQRDVREVIDTHFGENANPWCLCARDKSETTRTETIEGETEAITFRQGLEEQGYIITNFEERTGYDDVGGPFYEIEFSAPDKKDNLSTAWNYWKDYNQNGEGLGFRIAFHNGELIAFRDGKESPRWWDRMDKPSDAPIIKGKKGKDGYRTVSLAYRNKTIPQYLEKVTGDNKNGTTIKKDLDGTVTDITSKKDGKKHGRQFQKNNDRSAYYTHEITEDYNQGNRTSFKEVRIYKDYKGKPGREIINFGRDEIRVDNITKYERTLDINTNKSFTTIEGTIDQKLYEEAKNPDAITDLFTKQNLKYMLPSVERYFYLQGEKVTITKNEQTDEVTINGEVQETRLRGKLSKSKLQLTELQNKKKPLPALLGKIQEIDKRIHDGTADDNDLYLKNSGVLEKMQELFGDGNYSATEVYNIVMGKLPDIPTSMDVDFSSVGNFIKFIKKTLMPKIRSIGFEASKKHLSYKLNGVTKKSEKIRIINEFLINIGRSARDNYKEQGITTNRQLYNEVLMPLESIIGKNFIKNNYNLQKTKVGEVMVFKNKGGDVEIKGVMYSIVPLYKNIADIKMNARSNKEVVDEVNKESQLAIEYVTSIIQDPVLTKAEKLAIIDLMSLSQRGAVRKMYKMGETLTLNSTFKNVDDLILEHHYPVSQLIDHLQNRVKKGETYDAKLQDIITNLRVHVLPKEIDVLLNKEGKRSSGGFDRYTYGEIPGFFAQLFENGEIKTPPIYTLSKDNNNNLLHTIFQASKSKKPTKGISILDFDDTLATTNSKVIFTRPDGTKGSLNAEQYASTYEDLLKLGYKFDFSEFTKVVDGKPAPLLNKAKKLADKFGTKDMFILTARPPESAPAIRKFLKENGLNIPLKNITGLGNSTSKAKALWVLDKASEGYNDFYFADDAIQNVEAVQNMLDQVDVKSKVQQAKIKFSKSRVNEYFNGILRDVSGLDINRIISEAEARRMGQDKGKGRWFIPPSHEDFIGLLYSFMSKGKRGDNARKFFETTLIKPLNRAYRRLNAHRQTIANNYQKLIKHMPGVHSILLEKTPAGDFTYEDAIRVYLWNKSGYEIPGLSKEQENRLVGLVKQYSDLQQFADHLGRISLIKKGYTTPGDNWSASNIKFDLVDATGRVGRAKFFEEFQQNADIIFSKENLNKIEAIYGKNFREALEDSLYRTKTGSNRPTGGNRIVNAWLDWINGSVGAVMFFNMRSALLQQLSFVNFMNFADNNLFKSAARFADQDQYWKDFSYLFNSDFLKQRRAGAAFDVNANEIAREVSKARHPVRKAIRYLLDKGFLPTQLGDSFAIAVGGASFYRNRINTYLKQGLTQKEAQSKAFIDFQTIAEETQQSARPDMISQQQASPLGRFILAFQNVTSQYARIVKKSYLDLINRRISKGYTSQGQSDKANISRIVYYGAVQSMVFYGLQTALFAMLFDDDERDKEFIKDKKYRVLNESFNSLIRGTGVYGAVAITLKEYVFKLVENSKSDSYFKSPAWEKLLEISPPIGIKVRKWRSMERTLDWNKDVIDNMSLFDIDNPIYDAFTTGIEGFTNIPINRLYRKINNLRNGMDSENQWWQRIFSVAGWGEWELGIDKKIDRKDFKNKTKEKENKKLQEEEREAGGKVFCAASTRSGSRCKNEVLSNGDYCTIHAKVEKNKSGKKSRCKRIKSNGERCKMQTNAKSGYCYYHD